MARLFSPARTHYSLGMSLRRTSGCILCSIDYLSVLVIRQIFHYLHLLLFIARRFLPLSLGSHPTHRHSAPRLRWKPFYIQIGFRKRLLYFLLPTSNSCCIIFKDFSFDWLWKAKPKKFFFSFPEGIFLRLRRRWEDEEKWNETFHDLFSSSRLVVNSEINSLSMPIHLSLRREDCVSSLLSSRVTLHDTASEEIYGKDMRVIFTQICILPLIITRNMFQWNFSFRNYYFLPSSVSGRWKRERVKQLQHKSTSAVRVDFNQK